ncbi:uncharacterized protein EAF01_010700 [Botrytis porri]|uniref:uncharacterized protein n=1 Tax=Botrytis porri TaxID=87229 RepID=UPI001901156C|nr:uncharacterized protein EAF01_010700 [Botrytis porri]KAF7890891.1 hypothetical protein EAF01_010700 [Botrytis porri]
MKLILYFWPVQLELSACARSPMLTWSKSRPQSKGLASAIIFFGERDISIVALRSFEKPQSFYLGSAVDLQIDCRKNAWIRGTKSAREYIVSLTCTINSYQKNQPDPEGDERKLAPKNKNPNKNITGNLVRSKKKAHHSSATRQISKIQHCSGSTGKSHSITNRKLLGAANRSQPVATPKLRDGTDQPRPAPERYVPPLVPARKLDGKVELDKTRTNLSIMHTWTKGKWFEGYLSALSYFH